MSFAHSVFTFVSVLKRVVRGPTMLSWNQFGPNDHQF